MTSAQPPAPDLANTPAAGPADPLERLAQVLGNHSGGLPLVRYGGRVTEVSATHIYVRGLERRVELGSSVEVEGGGERWLGEVIGIQPDCANVKLFSTSRASASVRRSGSATTSKSGRTSPGSAGSSMHWGSRSTTSVRFPMVRPPTPSTTSPSHRWRSTASASRS